MELVFSPTETVEDVERRLILAALQLHAGNKRQTAMSLGISLKTLYNKLAQYANR